MVTNVTNEAKIILDTVDKIEKTQGYNVGKYFIANYLSGERDKHITFKKPFNDNQKALFGCPSTYIYIIIDALISKGYLNNKEYKKFDSINYTIEITDAGKKLITSDEPIELDINANINKVANGIYSLDLNRLKAIKKYYFRNFITTSRFCALTINNKDETAKYFKHIFNSNSADKIIKDTETILNSIDYNASANYFKINSVSDGSIYDLIVANKELITNELNRFIKYRNISELFRFVMSTLKVYVPKVIQDEFINKVTKYLIDNNYLKSEKEIGTKSMIGLVVTTRQSVEFTNITVELSTSAQIEIISKIEEIAKV